MNANNQLANIIRSVSCLNSRLKMDCPNKIRMKKAIFMYFKLKQAIILPNKIFANKNMAIIDHIEFAKGLVSVVEYPCPGGSVVRKVADDM